MYVCMEMMTALFNVSYTNTETIAQFQSLDKATPTLWFKLIGIDTVVAKGKSEQKYITTRRWMLHSITISILYSNVYRIV